MERSKYGILAMMLIGLFAGGSVAVADAIEGRKSSAEILDQAEAADWVEVRAENLLVLSLERGEVYIALSTTLAQSHVEQMRTLTAAGFYDGLSFYRVIDGFVAQGGDLFENRKVPDGTTSLAGTFDEKIDDDFSFSSLKDNDGYAVEVGFSGGLPTGTDTKGAAWHLHCAGAFALGRENGRDTAFTEFYVTLQPQRYLDRNLTVFGRVIEGMEHLQALRRVHPAQTPQGDRGEAILSMRMAADLPADQQPRFEFLEAAGGSFADFVEARRNRPEEFFYFRPDYIDICQLPMTFRRKDDG